MTRVASSMLHREIALQDEHDELHRRIIVVEHQHFVVADGFLVRGRVRVTTPVSISSSPSPRPGSSPVIRISVSHHSALKYGNARERRRKALRSVMCPKKSGRPTTGSGRISVA